MGRVLLDTTESGPSPAFELGYGPDAWMITCEVFAAGSPWTMQYRSDSDAPWAPTGLEWDGKGAKRFSGSDSGQFRISGGTDGARFVADLAHQNGLISGPNPVGG